MLEESLIIFVKNPVLGKVKTRLAADIGNEKALKVYQYLLNYTKDVLLECPFDKVVYYLDEIAFSDIFEFEYFDKELQNGFDLGDRMQNAIKASLDLGYKKAVLIGSDCAEITSAIIEEAFEKLNNHDVVLGPAIDGGYYLIGMQKSQKQLFKNKQWGGSNVLVDTLLDLKEKDNSYYLLPALNDVDTLEDLKLLTTKLKQDLF